MHIYLNGFANTHIHVSTSTHFSNSVKESARDKTCLERDRWTEKWMGWTVNSIQEAIWARKIKTCWEKSTLSLLDRVPTFLSRHRPMWILVWKKNPSCHKRSPSERDRRNFPLLECLLEKEQNSCMSNVGLSLLTMFNIWLNLWHSWLSWSE